MCYILTAGFWGEAAEHNQINPPACWMKKADIYTQRKIDSQTMQLLHIDFISSVTLQLAERLGQRR